MRAARADFRCTQPPICQCLIACTGWISMMMFSVRFSRIAQATPIFHGHGQRDDHPNRQPAASANPRHAKEDVAHGIEHAVAVVIQRGRFRAVAVDDERGVFQHLPRGFEPNGEEQAEAERPFAPPRQPGQPVQNQSLDNVGERIPIRDLLGILRAVHRAGGQKRMRPHLQMSTRPISYSTIAPTQRMPRQFRMDVRRETRAASEG